MVEGKTSSAKNYDQYEEDDVKRTEQPVQTGN